MEYRAGQLVKGEAAAEFTEKFLETFDPAIRTNIEEGIERLHSIRNISRFRKELIMFLAAALHNQTVSGQSVDILKLGSEANLKAVSRQRS